MFTSWSTHILAGKWYNGRTFVWGTQVGYRTKLCKSPLTFFHNLHVKSIFTINYRTPCILTCTPIACQCNVFLYIVKSCIFLEKKQSAPAPPPSMASLTQCFVITDNGAMSVCVDGWTTGMIVIGFCIFYFVIYKEKQLIVLRSFFSTMDWSYHHGIQSHHHQQSGCFSFSTHHLECLAWNAIGTC